MATVIGTGLKVRVYRAELLKALKHLRPLTTGKAVTVLTGVLFETVDDTLFMTATNMEVALRVGLCADIEGMGAVVIPARELLLAVEYGAEEITIAQVRYQAHVVNGADEFTIDTLSADQFPKPVEGYERWFTIGRADLAEMAAATGATAGHDEAKPWLTGTFLITEGGTLTGLTTDGVRVCEWLKSITAERDANCICVPGAVKLAAQMAAPGEGVQVLRTEHQIQFAGHDWRVTSRLIDGKYPDVRVFIPKESTSAATMDKTDILSACNLAMRWQGDGTVRMEFTRNTAAMSHQVPDVGGFTRRLRATVDGAPEAIGINSALLAPMLKQLTGEVTMHFTTGKAPVLVTSKDQPCIKYVILPLITF